MIAEEQFQLNLGHATNPGPGDYWHEMATPVCVVLGVCAGMVIICDTTQMTVPGRWTWDLAHRRAMSLSEFRSWLEYDSLPSKFWADVQPESHLWVTEEI